jgi:two-component system, chemotaxis family, CheB/CheR fusion protein
MYLNADTQARVLRKLNFALSRDGLLVLGKAETLLTHGDLFAPLDLKQRLFARVTRRVDARDRLLAGDILPRATAESEPAYRLAFEAAPIALVVVDADGRVGLINDRAALEFALSSEDVGRPFQDLELSYRPADLRSCIDEARLGRRAIVLKDVERTLASGESQRFDIEVTPLRAGGGTTGALQVAFTDVSAAHRLGAELQRVNAELDASHEELQSTSEELETTNEELQSTVEELETTNEELQATNEELETMNEELQATNEELQTMNEELRQRGDELNHVNDFFSSTLASLPFGVAVLDRELCVTTWNQTMEHLWGVRAAEVEAQPFLAVDIGAPVGELAPLVRACLRGEAPQERLLDCTNRRGRATRCKVMVGPLQGGREAGVVIVFEEVLGG